jgi:predicted dithiol-disulfide oxidoreductase (DUF899 family)
MTNHTLVSQQDWLNARRSLLEREKAFTHERERLATERRALPWVEVTKNYVFDAQNGKVSLPELFQGRSQLVVYHFMFAPERDAGCPGCSIWADSFDGVVTHLAGNDVTLLAVSSAPLEKLLAYRARLGWHFDWVSARGSDFSSDFGVTFSAEQAASDERIYNYGREAPRGAEKPGISVFFREGERIFHTYSCYARGLDMMNIAHQYLDLVPKGRNENGPMSWLKRRDEYGL